MRTEPYALAASPAATMARLGDYELGAVIGQGSSGVVRRAYDTRLERSVALKLLNSDAESREAHRQFGNERAALSQLNHSYIAKLYETGEVDGVPFLAMELVEGEPINSCCDRERLRLDARLRLFMAVCDGVQHAHVRSVLHRDLKPSNVLVVAEAGGLQPKIIDFGLARGLDRLLFAEQMPTLPGLALGTLIYMSPEQARGAAVDTRTDVHALGVMLYDLLCGALPIDPVELEGLELPAALARVQAAQQAPARPSQRFVALQRRDPARAAAVAAARRVSEAQLLGTLVGDLDLIVLRAIAEDCDKRYGMASELARDIDNYLRQLPVDAREPSLGYRLRKFVRRNRWPVMLGAAVLVSVAAVAGTGVAVYAMRQAERSASLEAENARLAQVESRLKNAQAQVRAGDEARQRGRDVAALDHYAQAREAGYDDAVGLRIRVVEALDGARRYQDARVELQKLRQLASLGDYAAKVEVLAADLGVHRLVDPDHSLSHARRALELARARPGILPPADELYARVLLSESPTEALNLLRQVREHDPYHRRATECLGVTLLVLGREGEAHEFAQVLQTLYPDDAQTWMFAICVAAFDGQRDEMQRLLARIRDTMGDAEYELARLTGELAFVKHDGNDLLRKMGAEPNDLGAALRAMAMVFGRVIPLAQQLQDLMTEGAELALGEPLHRMPPAIVRTYRPLFKAFLGGEKRGALVRDLAEGLASVSASAPEATVPYLHGIVLAAAGKPMAAARAIERALSVPAGIIEHRTMLVPATVVGAYCLLHDQPTAEEKTTIAGFLRRWVELAAAVDDLVPGELDQLILAADLVRSPRVPELVMRFLRVSPDDVRAQLAYADWLLEQGAVERARAMAADAALSEDASESMRRLRDRIVAGRPRRR